MSDDDEASTDQPTARRRYDNRLRREREAQTREQIVAAGSALAHESPTWEWSNLTFRAVAERAGVSVRTVFRHFPTENELQAAIMDRLDDQAGVDYSTLTLGSVAETAARVFRSLGAFAAAVDRPTPAAVIRSAGHRRREALLAAAAASYPEAARAEQVRLAAALDVLWNTASFVQLVDSWDMTAEDAIDVLQWSIEALNRTAGSSST